MKNARIVTVVGGSGFIGGYVVRQLVREGATVRILCRYPQAAYGLKLLGDVGQVVPQYFDLSAARDIEAALAGSHAVVNLVGVLAEAGAQRFQALHAKGAAALATAAANLGIARFVQISALGVDKAASSTYARSKRDGEAAVLAAFPGATILRPSVVFGREDQFFNKFASLARTGFLPLIGGGQTRFQPVYVADVAAAVSAVLKDDATMGRTYELAGPERLTLRGIYDFIAKATDHPIRYLSLPFALAGLMGSVAGLLPKAPLTADQVRLLKSDNVVSENARTLRDLGIVPTAIEQIVPEYLDRFRRRGKLVPS